MVATRNSYGNLKRILKQYCDNHFIKFRMAFVIPPVDNVNDELLTGHGKLYDQGGDVVWISLSLRSM